MTKPLQFELLGLNLQELTGLTSSLGEPGYRARQICQALYKDRVSTLNAISTLPRELRERLEAEGYRTGFPTSERRFQSIDGTVRYLFKLGDGETVETVWMPEGDDTEANDVGENWKRSTICVSSQVGCAVNCQFCLTAKLGIKRNLTAGEIVGQVLVVLEEQEVAIEKDRINLVFMGMGEPFLNYDNFMKAVRLLVEDVGIPQSRMTVSTAGIVPRIYDFGREEIRPRLAISLNASNDNLRAEVMPINKKWNIEAMLDAIREFPLRNRERVTFEYVLLAGINDALENAAEVEKLLRGIPAKVNLIALNPGPGIPYTTPEDDRVKAFQNHLIANAVPAFVRRPRGRDIFAACGQLKQTQELVSVS